MIDKKIKLKKKKEYGEICEELNKIIKYIKEDDDIQGNTNKMSSSKALDKSKTVRLQVAEVYRDFYCTCLEKVDFNFQEKMCEPDYKLFYPIYIKTTSPVYQKLISDTKKEMKHITYEAVRKKLKDRITQGKSSFKKAILDYYEKYSDSNKRLKFSNCPTSRRENKKLCLKIENNKVEKEIDEQTGEFIKPKEKDGVKIDYASGRKENYVAYFDKDILFVLKKKYLTLYQILLAFLWALPFGLSLIMVVGFFYQLFVNYSVIVKLKQQIILIEVISVAIIFMCLRMGMDFNMLENKKKTVPSKLTRFLLIPFFLALTMKRGKFINPFMKNILLYIRNNNELIISKISAECPICKSVGKKSALVLKSKKMSVIAECEEEPMHTFDFDHVTMKGDFPRKGR